MIDPKLLADEEDPALQAANQQMQAMAAEMDQMHQMLNAVHQSIEAQQNRIKEYEADIKAYEAETRRISAVQAGMSEEQIQDIVRGTIHAAVATGDIVGMMPEREMPDMGEGMQ